MVISTLIKNVVIPEGSLEGLKRNCWLLPGKNTFRGNSIPPEIEQAGPCDLALYGSKSLNSVFFHIHSELAKFWPLINRGFQGFS